MPDGGESDSWDEASRCEPPRSPILLPETVMIGRSEGKFSPGFPSECVAPAELERKRPELSARCAFFPDGERQGSVFPGTMYFALPDFLHEHAIYVERAHLLMTADTVIAMDAAAANPSRTCLSWCQGIIRRISIGEHRRTLRFCNYSTQYRLQAGIELDEYVGVWREIGLLPITTVVTGHGVFRGAVRVTQEDMKNLIASIEAGPSCFDRLGRAAFSICAVKLCPGFFRDWAVLF
jgi:hypothetical protein